MRLIKQRNNEGVVYPCKRIVLANQVILTTLLLLLLLIPIVNWVHYVDFVTPVLAGEGFHSGRHGTITGAASFLILMTGIGVLWTCFLFKMSNGSPLTKTKWNAWVFALLIAIPFSALFAWNKRTALFGLYDNHEGVLTYCGYLFIFLLVLHQKWLPKQLLKMWLSLIPFLCINLMLGVCFVFNFNLLKYPIVYRILGSENPFPENTFLHTTAYNPNFMSGISGTLYVLFLLLMLLHPKRKVKIAALFTALICFLVICTSISFSGFLLAIVFSPVLLVFALVKQKRRWKQTITYFLSLLLLMAICYVPLTIERLQVWEETFGNLLGITAVFQATGEEANLSSDEAAILPELPEMGFSAFTGRDYIWQKTLEVWRQSPIFGTGLETLPFYVDEDDVNKMAKIGSYEVATDKPHSLYLGWLYGGGIVTFLALFSFFTALCIALLGCIWKGSSNVVLLATGAAMVAYLTQGLVNDSRISTSIIFWVITGIFVSELMAEQRESQAKPLSQHLPSPLI